MRFIRRTGGFLMLEVILAICALSIIGSIGISRMRTLNSQKKHETIQQNYEIIRCAISAFLFRNSRLPKPAGALADGNEQDEILSGYVPYKALGLPKSCATDNEGNAIYYTPHPELTKNFSYINYDSEKDIQVDDSLSFCHSIRNNPIKLIHNHASAVDENGNFVIAYVLSDKQPIVAEETVSIEVTKYTSWLTRDLLLTKYLKLPPCKCMKSNTHINVVNEDDLF